MRRALLAFEPPDGGVAEHVGHLAHGLHAHGWQVEVVGPPSATIYAQLERAEIRVHRIGGLGRGYSRPWRDLSALFALRALLRGGRFELLHCHASKAGLLGRLAALGTRTPIVYTPHCFGFVGEVSFARRILARSGERVLGRRTAALICVADAELREAESHGIGARRLRRRIYNGCEPCAAAPAPIPLPAHPDGLVAGCIAVFRRQKRLDVLIDAAPRVLAAVPNAEIVIIGEGPLRAELERQVRALDLLEHDRFHFVAGFTPPSAGYLRHFQLFVLSSGWEAFPISILEALACGVPQVATDVGGTGEAMSSRTGVLVPAGDPTRLADAIIDLLRDPERRAAMAQASLERFEACYLLERMVAETDQVYRAVLEH